MIASTELHVLCLVTVFTLLLWLPYVLARIATRGLMATMGNPDPLLPPDPPWAQRAKLAHQNAIENLAVFAPLVLIVAVMGISTPSTVLAVKLYLGARVVHYIVYAAGVPVLRTLAFFVGVAACLMLAMAVLGR